MHRRLLQFKRIRLTSLLLLLPSASLAGSELYDLSLDELLEVKITSATLSPKTLNSAPASVSLFTAQEIENLGVQTLEELINYAPGYQSAKRGDGSIPTPYSARGRAIGTSSTEVIVLLDGRRIDNAISGGQSASLPAFSLSNIETVEFLRGPASSLYGSNAFLGVINLKSRRDQNALRVSLGSHQTRTLQADFSQETPQGLAISFHAQRQESDGPDYRVFDKFTNQIVDTRAPYETLDLDLILDFGNTEFSAYHSERISEGYLALGNISPDFNYSKNAVTFLHFNQNIPSPSLERLQLTGGVRRREFELHAQSTPARALLPVSQPPSAEPVLIKAQAVELEPWLQINGQYQSDSSYNLLFGLEYRSQQLDNNEIRSNYDLAALSQLQFPITYFQGEFLSVEDPGKQTEDIMGAFLQFENEFSNADTLTLGLRYDSFSYASSRLSPRLTYVHPIKENGFLKLIWGEAYRAPNISERNVSPNNIQVGNPNLKSETVTTAEIVLGGNWDHAYASLSLFENEFQNSIIQTNVNGLRTFMNLAEDRSRGIEAEGILHLNESDSFRASFTHFLAVPKFSFRDSRSIASLSFNHSDDDWNLNLSALYHSRQKNPTADPNVFEHLPSYTTFNAKLSYRLTPQSSLNLRATNLLDKTYYTASQPILPGGAPNLGRSLSLDYQINW